jgi:hypothetical protein
MRTERDCKGFAGVVVHIQNRDLCAFYPQKRQSVASPRPFAPPVMMTVCSLSFLGRFGALRSRPRRHARRNEVLSAT